MYGAYMVHVWCMYGAYIYIWHVWCIYIYGIYMACMVHRSDDEKNRHRKTKSNRNTESKWHGIGHTCHGIVHGIGHAWHGIVHGIGHAWHGIVHGIVHAWHGIGHACHGIPRIHTHHQNEKSIDLTH